MSWARFSDTFYRNDKQLAMSDAAFRIYVCGICYAMQEAELTGFLSDAQLLGLVRYLRKKSSVRVELVSIKAWEEVANGILIHDFELYIEPSSRERTKAWRDRKRAERDVTNTPRTVTGDNVGDVTVTALARDESFVPVPGPVPVLSLQRLPRPDDGEVFLAREWEVLTSRPPSEDDKVAFRTMLLGATRLSHLRIAKELKIKLGERIRDGKNIPPASYYLRRIEELNASAADDGAPLTDRAKGVGGPSRIDFSAVKVDA